MTFVIDENIRWFQITVQLKEITRTALRARGIQRNALQSDDDGDIQWHSATGNCNSNERRVDPKRNTSLLWIYLDKFRTEPFAGGQSIHVSLQINWKILQIETELTTTAIERRLEGNMTQSRELEGEEQNRRDNELDDILLPDGFEYGDFSHGGRGKFVLFFLFAGQFDGFPRQALPCVHMTDRFHDAIGSLKSARWRRMQKWAEQQTWAECWFRDPGW